MTELNPAVPQGVNLFTLFLKSDSVRTSIEKEIIQIGQCGNSNYLEVSDFSDSACFRPTSTTVQLTAEDYYKDYRKRLIASIVGQQFLSPSFEKPKIDLTKLTDVIVRYSPNVTDLYTMISTLATVMKKQASMNENGLLLLVMLWVILANLKEAHQQWIAKGQSPVLPQNEMDAYFANAFKNLDCGAIGIGVLSSDNEGFVGGMYDGMTNKILFPMKYISDVLAQPDYEEVPIEQTVIHEFFHAYHDSLKEKIDRPTEEAKAHLFDQKAMTILWGEDRVRESCQYHLTAIKDIFSKRLAEIPSGLNTPLRYFLESMNSRVHSTDPVKNISLLTSHDQLAVDTAMSELKTGAPDNHGRLAIRRALAQGQTYTAFFKEIINFEKQVWMQPTKDLQPVLRKRYRDLPLPRVTFSYPPFNEYLRTSEYKGHYNEARTQYIYAAAFEYYVITSIDGREKSEPLLGDIFQKLMSDDMVQSWSYDILEYNGITALP
ncbi:MAG: hypothetical protein HY541_04910 [Deltaproteobacteria bacterium]|nr:hypothetical protein [Deltaproteobacteria bacterium]